MLGNLGLVHFTQVNSYHQAIHPHPAFFNPSFSPTFPVSILSSEFQVLEAGPVSIDACKNKKFSLSHPMFGYRDGTIKYNKNERSVRFYKQCPGWINNSTKNTE